MVKFFNAYLIAFILVAISTGAMAHEDVFSYHSKEVKDQLAPLSYLEQLHHENPTKSFDQLVQDNHLDNYNFAETSLYSSSILEPMPAFPAFWWGCLLGFVGIVIVYLVAQDKEEVKRALWGCFTNGLFLVFVYSAFFLTWGESGCFLWWWFF